MAEVFSFGYSNRIWGSVSMVSAGMSEIGCAWAPEVTYDAQKGKLMIYFTMRFRNEANKLYYVYVNDEFDTIVQGCKSVSVMTDSHVQAVSFIFMENHQVRTHVFLLRKRRCRVQSIPLPECRSARK